MCRDREKVLYHHVMVMWSSRDLWMDFRYECVDWLFCNAGLMPVSGVNWRAFWPPTPSNLGYQLGTGGDLLPVTDWQTSDGLQQVFSTNLFGHYLMVQELEGFLSAQTRDCHVIWTSSVTASRATFDPTDIQGKNRSSFYTILSLCIHVF
ncbi:3-keto-steroid reductase/17-beta-hydroxysteroid dehydrogenase 7, partial [Geodia barretti]